VSPYGASKYPAELIHERWAASVAGRRLVICRPGVVYGAGDPGNILRMIKAVKRGYFVYPGSPNIRKSYAYIEGLLDSIEFTMDRAEPLIKYNYVEYPTEPLGQLVENAKRLLNSRAPVIALPLSLLIPLAKVLHWLSGGRSPVHPMRVKKAARATHIVPRTLLDLEFRFRYDFSSSLVDWKARQPDDFS
jgi:nucleoside-diphosphate-sugar epimerase